MNLVPFCALFSNCEIRRLWIGVLTESAKKKTTFNDFSRFFHVFLPDLILFLVCFGQGLRFQDPGGSIPVRI